MEHDSFQILLIEDNTADAEFVAEMMGRCSNRCSLMRASTLSSAMGFLSEGLFDVVLLDLLLPDSNGLDTLRSIQSEHPTIPVIILTVLNSEDIATSAIRAGAQDYLIKGEFDADTLYRAIIYSTERKKTELALRESERRFSYFMQHLPAAAWIKDLQGKYVYANPEAERIFGFPLQLLIGKTDSEIFPERAATQFNENDRRALSESGSVETSEMLIQPDGIEHHSIVSKFTIPGSDGKPTFIAGMAYDITEREKTEERLRRSEQRLRRFYESNMIGLIFWNRKGAITDANDKFLEMVGYTREDLRSGRIVWSSMTPPEYRAMDQQALAELKGTGIDTPYEKEFIRKDGSRIPIFIGAAMLDEDRREGVAFVLDVTERKRAEELLKRSNELSEELNIISRLVHSTLDTDRIMTSALVSASRVLRVDGAAIGVFESEALEKISIRYIHNAPESLMHLCCSPEEGKGIQYIATEKDACAFNDIASDNRVNGSFWKRFGFSSMLAAPLMLRGKVFGAMLFFNNTSYFFHDLQIDFARKISISLSLAFDNARLYEERSRMEEEMRQIAHHDALTGLPNRRLFTEIIKLELTEMKRHNKKLALLFLDLDRFKEINDTLGHDIGDKLLKEAAVRLRSALRASDTVARIGGDEFNIILPDIERPEFAADVSRKILNAVKKPFSIEGREINTSTSIGISIFPNDSMDPEALLRYADIAMYHSKKTGRNTYKFYNPTIDTRSVERLNFENRLRQAVDRNELKLFYQPLIDLKSQQVTSSEVLVRWKHPEKGLLLPEQFFEAAEDIGFMPDIDEWVIRSSSHQIKKWIDEGMSPICITLNISARQFESPDMMRGVAELLAETRLKPGCLDIEIAESMAMKNIDDTISKLDQLHAMGVSVSIDDFGTGYSSLTYLKRLPIQKIKIDKSFVRDITNDPGDRTIIKAIIGLAHSMNLKVVAEGVEEQGQFTFLRDLDCDEIQGFFFSKPLPAEELPAFVMAGNRG